MNLNVQVKQAGKKVNKIKKVVMEIKEPPKTVEELLIAAVKQTRELFVQKRKKSEKLEQGDLSQVSLYNEEQIEDMASVGKVVFGFSLNNRVPSEKEAIETALQAFEDGLVAIFIEGTRYEDIKSPLALVGEETVTFVKLTMLTGRLW